MARLIPMPNGSFKKEPHYHISFLNDTDKPITINTNCMIGFISLTSPYQVANLDEMSSPTSLSEWEGNASYSSLSPTDQMKRRELVKSMIRANESPLMKSSDTVTNQVIDLMIKVWDFFIEKVILVVLIG